MSSAAMTATTRRAALGALASVPALAVPSVSVMAAPVTATGPNSELFQLIAVARQVGARLCAAEAAAEEAWQRTEKVPPPEVLIVTEADTRNYGKLKAGEPFGLEDLELIRCTQKHRQSSKLPSLRSILADAPYLALSEKDRAVIDNLIARDEREDQLVAALDEWREMRRVARDRSGETSADELLEKIQAEYDEACERVASTHARTLSGVLAKLAFIAPDLDAETWMKRGAEGGTHEEILYSVAVDYKALTTTV